MDKIIIPQYAANVLSVLNGAGFEAYAVGGCCRDALLGREPNDWDICTSALPEQIIALFTDSIPTGIKHGTISVKTENGLIEVTTFRVDGEYTDHRRPDAVCFTSKLREDLARRDFTMNALAVDLNGNITDCFGGTADIEKKLIRCVGNAEKRFGEDALRMFRAVRFAAQLSFSLDEELILAARKLAHTAAYVAAERIYTETIKALVSPAPETLALAFEWGLYPGIEACSPDLSHLKHLPADETTRLLALAATLFKGGCIASPTEFIKSLRGTALQIRASELIFSPTPVWLGRTLPQLAAAMGRELALYAAAVMEIYGFAGSIAKMEKLLSSGCCLSVKELDISGKDIMALGYSGKDVGNCLDILLQHVLVSPGDNKKEILLQIIKNRAEG